MKFDTTILVTLGFLIKLGKGYVAGVNPRLVRTKLTTSQSHVANKMINPNSEESTEHQNLVRAPSYDSSQIIFPSSSEDFNEKSDVQATDEQTRDESATRSFPSKLSSNTQTTREAQLSRYSSPFEFDDDDDRPVWSS